MNVLARTLSRLACLCLLVTSGVVMAQGLEGAVDAAERMNASLAKRNAAMVDRARLCSMPSMSGKPAGGAMAQYRCILAAGPSAQASLDRKDSMVTAGKSMALGPKPPAD